MLKAGAPLFAAMLAACSASPGGNTAAPTPEPASSASPTPSATVSACRTQDGAPLSAAPIDAKGTEPFWAAKTDGRCVTYSTPEDQAGTRVWAQYQAADGAPRWTGALDGQPFVMEAKPAGQTGCSDGMSDRRYAMAVTLTVRGEMRKGCADPLGE